MNKKNFGELMESLQEGGEVLRGTKRASRTWSVIWATYWFATVKFKPYLRASERITANDSVAKFWNSSTYR